MCAVSQSAIAIKIGECIGPGPAEPAPIFIVHQRVNQPFTLNLILWGIGFLEPGCYPARLSYVDLPWICGWSKAMETDFKRIRPGTFFDGEDYLLEERAGRMSQRILVPVTFIAYDASPAFVIVRQEDRRLRRPRDDLFAFAAVTASPSS